MGASAVLYVYWKEKSMVLIVTNPRSGTLGYMELSERYIQKLEREFPFVFE